MNKDEHNGMKIGWAVKDVTPEHPVNLAGQFHMRISKGVQDPVTVTAMALSTEGPAGDSAVFVSCDRPTLRDRQYEENTFLRRCHEAVRARSPEIDVNKIILNATHTHSAPNTTIGQYEDVPDGVMTPEEYMEVLLEGIGACVAEAWENRKPGGVSWGLGTAVVGHNRRATYFREHSGELRPGLAINGFTRMYGETNDPNFSHIEGYEDHYLDMLYTWDNEKQFTGIALNLACPAQETQMTEYVSADFWHEIRTEIRKNHGEHIQILAQCSAAGDQSPSRLWYKQAERRMLELRGLTMRQEIGRRVAHSVNDVLPVVRNDIRTNPVFRHIVKNLDLPRMIVSDEDAEKMRGELAVLEAETEKGIRHHSAVTRCRRILQRYEIQQTATTLPTELHLVRLGDVAFVTNRFELFLDFGVRIKARSPAVQTFIVQLAADNMHSGTYLPSERAIANKGYGASVLDNEIGPEGGKMIVEETVKGLNELWDE